MPISPARTGHGYQDREAVLEHYTRLKIEYNTLNLDASLKPFLPFDEFFKAADAMIEGKKEASHFRDWASDHDFFNVLNYMQRLVDKVATVQRDATIQNKLEAIKVKIEEENLLKEGEETIQQIKGNQFKHHHRRKTIGLILGGMALTLFGLAWAAGMCFLTIFFWSATAFAGITVGPLLLFIILAPALIAGGLAARCSDQAMSSSTVRFPLLMLAGVSLFMVFGILVGGIALLQQAFSSRGRCDHFHFGLDKVMPGLKRLIGKPVDHGIEKVDAKRIRITYEDKIRKAGMKLLQFQQAATQLAKNQGSETSPALKSYVDEGVAYYSQRVAHLKRLKAHEVNDKFLSYAYIETVSSSDWRYPHLRESKAKAYNAYSAAKTAAFTAKPSKEKLLIAQEQAGTHSLALPQVGVLSSTSTVFSSDLKAHQAHDKKMNAFVRQSLSRR